MDSEIKKPAAEASLKEAEDRARQLAQAIESKMPNGWGFVLLLAAFGKHAETTYIANISRHNVKMLFREILEHMERKELPEEPPTAESPATEPGPDRNSRPPSSPS